MPTTIETSRTSRHPSLLRRAMRRLLRRAPADPGVHEENVIRQSGMFDAPWYLERYPDVAASGMDPVTHYVRHGASEGRNPSATFDTAFYLARHADVAASGMNPFRHYVEFGRGEKRAAMSAKKGVSVTGHQPDMRPDAEVIAEAGALDREYYLASNPDVAASGMNPLVHFCKYGSLELRNPSSEFDMAWYWLTQLAESNPMADPLTHYLRHEGNKAETVRKVGILANEDNELARTIANSLLQKEDHEPAVIFRLGAALSRLKLWDEAEKALGMAVSENWGDARVHARLAAVLSKRGKWWQAVDSWSEAVRLDDSRGDWFFRLGEAQEKMSRFELAAGAYQRAVEREPECADWHYRMGYALERSGQCELAKVAYRRAIDLGADAAAEKYGIGVLHQAHGYWPEAAEAYESALKAHPASPELHYRLGMAHGRCYRWQKAEQCYRTAIALKSDTPYWHYRYGFVLERQKRYAEAAEAYAAAATLSSARKPYWWYRRGYVLATMGEYEAACKAYIETCEEQTLDGGRLESPVTGNPPVSLDKYLAGFPSVALLSHALETDATDECAWYHLGQVRERQKDWSGAAEAYAEALKRSNSHRPHWHYRLGIVLFLEGRFEQACLAFNQVRIIQRAYGISEKSLANAGLGVRLTTIYAEYCQTLSVDDKVILYESHIGKSISCSPLGIFRELTDDPSFSDYIHVWVVDDKSRIPSSMKKLSNVIFAERLSDLYLRYLATAGYLINNTGFPPYFIRRQEQKYLATWHGTPLKTLGKQQTYKFLEHKRTQRNFLQATHIISPNPHTTDVLLDSYDIRHIMDGKLAETGYPRIDLTLNASEQERAEVRRELGVSGERPVVLYAPTWRGTLETVAYDIERAKVDLRHIAERHDCDVIFRGHHLMEKVFGADADLGCTVVPSIIDTNVLLSVVDVLITDYSSIFFDFLPTGRPVLYYVYDRESYERERGLYFSMDEMPGYKCMGIDDLDVALGNALQGELADGEHHARAQQAFNSHDDGHAASRVVDFFFHDDPSHVVSTGPHAPLNVLMNGGGFKRNGITTSFLNLANQVESQQVQVTVAVSPDGMEYDAECREQFDRLPEDIEVVARCGIMTMTWEERWLRRHFRAGSQVFDGERLEIMRDLYDREFLRVFGRSHFDVVVAFSGYDTFWAAILLLNRREVRKAVYMHSDMYAEYVAKFPDLVRMFHLYGFADALVSVCPESNACNRDQLAPWLHIPPERFVSSENMQDAERILELADGEIEERDRHLFDIGKVFINMGRLSVEKDHAKMIRAFANIRRGHADTRLVILGAGPLKAQLTQLIGQLQLTDCVHILGFRSNPYPYLRKADCFVLSSNHEAKTMSLMEAMIVGLPYVATDIAGNRDIKREYPAYFYPNSEQGLEQGMRDFLAGELAVPEFDWRAHQAEAVRQFDERVLGMSVLPAPPPAAARTDA